ncbi:hypothetical protein BJF78_35265 [Pseudonocardia sp. CNS-139]|nr:hypothetical protein BJF78_35265 [Pseudonocardia sp. CNS-139]
MTRPVRDYRRFILPAAVAVLVAGVVALFVMWLRADADVAGVTDGGSITPAAAGRVAISPYVPADRVQVQLDGAPAPVTRDGERILLAVPSLPEGEHSLVISGPDAMLPLPGNSTRITFTVDGTPPGLALDPLPITELGSPVDLHGRADGASELLVNGAPHPIADDGTFSVAAPPGTADLDIAARDAAGNVTAQQVPIPVRHPGMRAVHMTAYAWASGALREPVLQLAREGRIDTVQLDIKDESGIIGYLSQVPLAQEIGAASDVYNPREALDQLHAAGLRVVGRIVAFRDPVLGKHSWQNRQTERLVQTASGSPYSGGYGQYSFTNFANPDVRAYNAALAEEGAALGFDEILYDYVRRPDGNIAKLRFQGLTGTPEQSIADFLGETRPLVRKHGALLGASVYGISATRPEQIAQDIRLISQHADYVAPMVYPSHWGRGEYGVANPDSQPYDITARSLADFVTLTEDSATAVIPWLQAFTLRHAYGPAEVRAQIEAAESNGINSFILWDPNCKYTQSAALEPKPKS